MRCLGHSLVLLIWLALLPYADAFSGGVADVPNPLTDPKRCGRATVPRSAICDPDDILPQNSKDAIEGYINGIAPRAQVAVLAVVRMGHEVTTGRSVEEAAEVFARGVHDKWGVGDKVSNNGVLIFLSVDDRAVYISTGSGVSSVLTKQRLNQIIAAMAPDLRAQRYGAGLERSVVEVGVLLGGKAFQDRFQVKSALSMSSVSGDTVAVVGVASCFGLAILFARRFKSADPLESGRRALKAFAKEVSAGEEENKYHATSCPVCLEEFPPAPPADAPSAANKSPKRPMAIGCGHVFCYQCLGTLAKTPSQPCPICRQPMDPEGPKPYTRPFFTDMSMGSGLGQSSSMYLSGGSRPGWREWRMAENRYRMSRLRTLYPDVVTPDVYSTLDHSLQTGDTAGLKAAAAARSAAVAELISERAREQARKSGSHGHSGGGFGGGCSSGGGGGRF